MSQSNVDKEIDNLLWKWHNCRDEEDCKEAWKKVHEYLRSKWVCLVEWSRFEAFGAYYVSPDLQRCIYIHRNLRTDPVTRSVEEVKFKDPVELANRIWLDQKGCIPFEKIKKRIRDVFGVDAKMSPENKLIRVLFGEASK
jgi:hypothetical protein